MSPRTLRIINDSDGSTTDEDDVGPKDANDNPGSVPLPTNPSADGRAWSSLSEEEGRKSPNRTQVKESSSAVDPHVNCGASTAGDKANWILDLLFEWPKK
jgi:hypothetical protein